MPGLLYYVPKLDSTAKLADIKAAGLSHCFTDHYTASGVRGGPDGTVGIIVADDRHVDRIGYYADKQTWRRIPGSDAWVGMFRDAVPGPTDLARPKIVPGHSVELVDGNKWTIPLVRELFMEGAQPKYRCALPSVLTGDDDGNWHFGEILPQYRQLALIAEAFWQQYLEGLEACASSESSDGVVIRFDGDLAAEHAITMLSANYRIAKAEAWLLGLLTAEHVRDILFASVDGPSIAPLKKKLEELGIIDSFNGVVG